MLLQLKSFASVPQTSGFQAAQPVCLQKRLRPLEMLWILLHFDQSNLHLALRQLVDIWIVVEMLVFLLCVPNKILLQHWIHNRGYLVEAKSYQRMLLHQLQWQCRTYPVQTAKQADRQFVQSFQLLTSNP